MNFHPSSALTFRLRIVGALVALLLATLAWMAAAKLMMPARPLPSTVGTAAPLGRINPLIHWRRDGHHWLVVADRRHQQLVVYDAESGRPLGRQPMESQVNRYGVFQGGQTRLVTSATSSESSPVH